MAISESDQHYAALGLAVAGKDYAAAILVCHSALEHPLSPQATALFQSAQSQASRALYQQHQRAPQQLPRGA